MVSGDDGVASLPSPELDLFWLGLKLTNFDFLDLIKAWAAVGESILLMPNLKQRLTCSTFPIILIAAFLGFRSRRQLGMHSAVNNLTDIRPRSNCLFFVSRKDKDTYVGGFPDLSKVSAQSRKARTQKVPNTSLCKKSIDQAVILASLRAILPACLVSMSYY